ncbi:hypothetical protein VC116059_001829A, partial [Vibrio cholerae O1 str. 116059]
MRAPPPP